MSRRNSPDRVLNPALLRASGALLAAQTALSKRIEVEAVAPTGHDPTVVDLLTRLDQAPNFRLRAVELSQQLMMSASHISRMLDRAEIAGLISREPDPTDRRASQVAITEAGRRVLADFAPRLESIIERAITQALEPDEIDNLVAALSKIQAAAGMPGLTEPA